MIYEIKSVCFLCLLLTWNRFLCCFVIFHVMNMYTVCICGISTCMSLHQTYIVKDKSSLPGACSVILLLISLRHHKCLTDCGNHRFSILAVWDSMILNSSPLNSNKITEIEAIMLEFSPGSYRYKLSSHPCASWDCRYDIISLSLCNLLLAEYDCISCSHFTLYSKLFIMIATCTTVISITNRLRMVGRAVKSQ